MQTTNPGHQPERFSTYTLVGNGSTFKINNCTHLFKLDSRGGWKDQYGNYYNANGEAADSLSDNQSDGPANNSFNDDEDEFEREFGQPKDDQFEDQVDIRKYESIAGCKIKLQNYCPNAPLRVNFKNVSYRTQFQELMAAIQQRVKGILNIIFNKNEKGNDGTGFFVVQDVEAAENLVELEGEIICGRPIYFSVDEAEYLSMNPISTYQLGSVPKFYNSSLANKSENSELVKVEAPNLPNNQKLTQPVKPVKNEKIVEAVKQPQPEKPAVKESEAVKFTNYRFNKLSFVIKDDLKNWMASFGLKQHVDYRNAKKIPVLEGTATEGQVQLTENAHLKTNGAKHKGNVIHFVPM